MSLSGRFFPSLFYRSVSCSSRRCYRISHPFLVAELLHTEAGDSVVKSFCDAFRKGWCWDTVSKRFDSVELSSSIVEKVLLHFKEPTDAKRALGFFHWSKSKKFEHRVQSYSIAIHILVRAQMLTDARALLVSVLKKTEKDTSRFCLVDSLLSTYKIASSRPLVFDLLVQTYSKLRMLKVAFDVCCYLEKHGISLSLISFNTLIHVVEKSEKNVLVWKIYEHMIQRRIYPNEATINTLISAFCKEGNLQRYVDILDRIHGKRCSPVVIVNTSLIFRILEEGRIEEGMVLLKRMLQRNMILDTISYSLIVYAKVKLGNLNSAWEVYEEMVKRGFRANPFIYTLFIGAYCSEGRIEEANYLMQEMGNMGLKPYDETFNHLILGCSKAGRLEESLRFCEKMMEIGLVPTCSAFNEMVRKLCECGRVGQANVMLTLLLDDGFSPDEHTYCHLIDGYGKEGDVQEVLKLFYEMEYRLISPGLLGFTSLIRSLCECGKLVEAEKYLKIMKDRALVPTICIYKSLIASYNWKGDKMKVNLLYNEMIKEGLTPSCS